MAFSSLAQKLKFACTDKTYEENGTTPIEDVNKDVTNEKTAKLHTTSSGDWSEFERVYASDFNTKPGATKLAEFLSQVAGIAASYVQSERERGSKVVDFHHPHQLREILDHCLNVDENPRDLEQILSDCKETLKYCVKTAHPRFLNQLSTGLDVVGMVGEWIVSAANTNMFTYEMAPVFTLMEDVILQRMRTMIGWDDGDGIFAPGGAISNFYGLAAARHCACPAVKATGMSSETRFNVFTSDQSHFSIKRAAVLLGIGLDNVIIIKSDSRGKMIVDDLEHQIQCCLGNGRTPLLVNATCGTTVFGAFDPVDDLADICDKYGVWLHVDGAWGGSVLFSRQHKHLLSGLHRANSMTWNPHKMMGVPLQCSAVFLRQKGILYNMNQLGADYLFQKDKFYDTAYDTGDKAIQCGRHNDIFKLWLMWRSKGDSGFEKQIDNNFLLASYLLKSLQGRKEFRLVLDQIEGPNVCFWFLPPSLQQPLDGDAGKKQQLHKVAPRLKALMMEKGSMMLQYQPLGDLPNFFRVAFSNPAVTMDDVDYVVDELVRLGQDL